MPPIFEPDIQQTLLQKRYIFLYHIYLRGFNPLRRDIPVNFNLKIQERLSLKNHISTIITNWDSVCPVSCSLAVTNDIAFCFLFLRLLRCFNSAGSRSSTDQQITNNSIFVRKSHQAILGSKDVCSSPRLIAAYHDPHKYFKPSHPPDGLICSIFFFTK